MFSFSKFFVNKAKMSAWYQQSLRSLTNLWFVGEDAPVACLRTDPQFIMVVPQQSTPQRKTLRGVPPLRTSLRPVSSGLQPLRGLRLRTAYARRLQPLRGFQRPATGTGMHFYASHSPALRLRGVPCLRTALAFGGAVFRPCGLRFAPCPRASSRFAAFDCALRVLGTSALRAFTFSQAFASTVRNRRSASLASSLAVLIAH